MGGTALLGAALVVSVLPAAQAANPAPDGPAPAGTEVDAAAVLTVSSLSSAGSGSLRAAIKTANSAKKGATIRFSVAGRIKLTKKLPEVRNKVSIDGTSAPGWVDGGPPVVEVDSNGKEGLTLCPKAKWSRIAGLALVGSSTNGLTLHADRVTVIDNYIGVGMSGRADSNAGSGIEVTSDHTRIGLNTSGDSGVLSNLISGNRGNGITVNGGSHNTIVANRIGTDAAGTAKVRNRGHGVVFTNKAKKNTLGGTEYTDAATGQTNDPTGDKGSVPPVFVVPPLGNLISGNRRDGVLIKSASANNVLNGNFVGTTADGDSALGNGGDGVHLLDAPGNSLIGCTFVENPFVYYNVLSGNGGHGLRITDSDDVTVHANFFGVGANNTDLVPNNGNGILVEGDSADTQVGGVIPLGNVSAGNRLNGIEVKDQVSGFITFNTFGGLLAFKGAAPNGRNGLLVTSTGGDNLARTNVFSGNTGNGIRIAGKARGVTVDPNMVGASTNGQSPLPNGKNGVELANKAHHNTIGGTRSSVIPQNLFSANLGYGLVLRDKVHDNDVQHTFIGTDTFGELALPNQKGGILVTGTANNNFIGLKKKTPANIISGNNGNGVTLTKETHDNAFNRNYIGLDHTGRDLPNSGLAISDSGKWNVFAGTQATWVR